MDGNTEVVSDSITLTGAGFTKAFFPEAPLLEESLGKTLEFINYEIKVKKISTYNNYLEIYKNFQRENRDLEMLLTKYFEFLEKKNNGETITVGEALEQEALGYLKYAFLHLIDSTTPWKSYWKDSDFSTYPESLNFIEYQRCRKIRELADYFIGKRGCDLQVTVNYDTLLDSIFMSFPEPEDHKHKIQHIHGSRAWYFDPTTDRIFSDSDSRTYSNQPNDPLILPIYNKEKWITIFPEQTQEMYLNKIDVITEHFKKCKRLTIIGCGLNQNDEILTGLINSLDRKCKVIYVANSCKNYEHIQKIFEKQTVNYLSCGFRVGCLS